VAIHASQVEARDVAAAIAADCGVRTACVTADLSQGDQATSSFRNAASAIGPIRHPREQCRPSSAAPRPIRVQRRGLGRGRRDQSVERLPAVPRGRQGHARSENPARSSTSRRCSPSRVASGCRPTPRRKAALHSSPRRSQMNGPSAGVNVNAIAPGYMLTDNTRPAVEDPVRYKDITARIPRAAWATPGSRRCGRVPRVACIRLRCTGTCSSWTGGGWPDEPETGRPSCRPSRPPAVVAVIRLKDPAKLRAVVDRDRRGGRAGARESR